MKNKLGISIDKFAELSSSGESDESSKGGGPRDSPAPRIIVCPPMDDRLSAPEATGARGARLLRALGRRISRRRTDDDASSDSSGSGSEAAWNGREHGSFSASEVSSEAGSERPRTRSSSSLCRVFQSLSISPRAQSCSAERVRAPKKNPQPQRILRPPVTYTYVRGLSGLTQRVPRPRVSGLHR